MGLGALAGALGSAVQRVLPISVLQLGARVAAALLLIAVGFYAAGLFKRWALLERATSPLFGRIGRYLAGRTGQSIAARVTQGVVWGLLPCGLVYGALGLAALTGSAGEGARVMLSFGAGTLPALIVVSIFADGFTRLVRQARVRQSAGLLLALAGSVHLALAMQTAFSLPRTLSPQPASDAAPAEEPPSCCRHNH
jgi:hypothetical protein